MLPKIFTGIIIIITIILVIFMGKYESFQKQTFTAQTTIIVIKEGDRFINIAEKVDGVSEFFLKYYIKKNPPQFPLQTGRYNVQSNATIGDIITALQFPIYIQESTTILEGWNIYDIDEYLSRNGVISTGEYITYVTNTDKISALSEFYDFFTPETISLEGFLYPDTYSIDVENFALNQFVISQLDNFEKKVYLPLLSQLDTKTIYDVINLASIVEKEEKNPAEKSTVAGILKKRLNEGWMIGADITVCYPYKLTSEECKFVVTKYIHTKNDYNTRTKFGLPKTPIGNPSHETIEATLNDTPSPYYFYLHDTKTGQIYYGKDNAEHERNKNNYLR